MGGGFCSVNEAVVVAGPPPPETFEKLARGRELRVCGKRTSSNINGMDMEATVM